MIQIIDGKIIPIDVEARRLHNLIGKKLTEIRLTIEGIELEFDPFGCITIGTNLLIKPSINGKIFPESECLTY